MAQELIENIRDSLDVRYNILQYKSKMVEDYINISLQESMTVDQIIFKMIDLIKTNDYDDIMIELMSQYLNELSMNGNRLVNLVIADPSWIDLLKDKDLIKSFPEYKVVNEKYDIW